METFSLGTFKKFELVEKPTVLYEFQALGLECEEFFGKSPKIWQQFYRKGVTEQIVRYALKESITRNKPFVNYFIAIINNKIK